MSTAGLSLKGLVAIPENTNPDDETLHTSMAQRPTESHALAMAEAEEKGIAQVEHDEEVLDLGWNEGPGHITESLVGGLRNEDLWTLIRRFDKQIYHLKETAKPPTGGLDLGVSEEEEFSPNKLRSQVERLYWGIIIGALASVKHLARLRSWRETRRTSAFCTIYFAAWAVNLLVPLLSICLVALIVSPRTRSLLFPPAPLALVDYKTGGPTKPSAGVLGSTDSATGAPENQKGEAVEHEASNFVTGIGAIALNAMTGADPQGPAETEAKGIGDHFPQPNTVASTIAVAKDKAQGVDKPSQDKTKVPMEQKMWAQMKPLMRAVCITSDTWERFSNALTPTPPFHRDLYRLRLSGLVVPLVIASTFVTANMVFRATTFAIGLGLFGDPVLTRAYNWLNRTYPNWAQILNVNNTLLKGVPTNAQLTVTLFRLGEANRAPLPPPPIIRSAPSQEPVDLTPDLLSASGGDQALAADHDELREMIKHHPGRVGETGGEDSEMTSTTTNSKKRSKLLSFFKLGTKVAVQTTLSADKIRAKVGTESAKQRLGAVPSQGEKPIAGPVEFKARFHGQKGHLHLTMADGDIQSVAFTVDSKSTKERIGLTDKGGFEPLWSVPVGEIRELQKHSGYGFKTKLAIGWAMDREIRDGLQIVDRTGRAFVVTAVPLRDELFNRLCAMGGQKWEVW